MTPLLISIAAFVGVAALVGAAATIFRTDGASRAENRLDALAAAHNPAAKKKQAMRESLVAQLGAAPSVFDAIIKRLGNLSQVFEQADTNLTPARFFAITGGLMAGGGMLAVVLRFSAWTVPVLALLCGVMPYAWLCVRRKRRMKKFASQLPHALELIARALRAGHSLASGMGLVASEMQSPIRDEFQRVFESQNLGIALEDALKSMCLRVPNLDLKFFVTAIILQRQTGGDLAEILDKIGYLIRERFRIWGQVQALTGEGRLSGIVLLGLPPCLFLAVYYLNPDYVMLLFTDPMGHKMLAAAVVLQIIGALVIRKIVNIKV
jgi:tight adherence protein B